MKKQKERGSYENLGTEQSVGGERNAPSGGARGTDRRKASRLAGGDVGVGGDVGLIGTGWVQ